MIFWSLPVSVFIFLLIYAFFEKVDKIISTLRQRKKDRESQRVFDLYRKMQILSSEERQAFLSTQPKRVKKRYEYGVSVWGEPK